MKFVCEECGTRFEITETDSDLTDEEIDVICPLCESFVEEDNE